VTGGNETIQLRRQDHVIKNKRQDDARRKLLAGARPVPWFVCQKGSIKECPCFPIWANSVSSQSPLFATHRLGVATNITEAAVVAID